MTEEMSWKEFYKSSFNEKEKQRWVQEKKKNCLIEMTYILTYFSYLLCKDVNINIHM